MSFGDNVIFFGLVLLFYLYFKLFDSIAVSEPTAKASTCRRVRVKDVFLHPDYGLDVNQVNEKNDSLHSSSCPSPRPLGDLSRERTTNDIALLQLSKQICQLL